jgi:gluconokinase
MIDKIRLHAKDALPPDYVENLGEPPGKPAVFDARMCRFLRLPYEELRDHVLAQASATDAQLLEWAEARAQARGHAPRSDEEYEIFNTFLMKRGWRDSGALTLSLRVRESGFGGRPDIATMFDYLDADEGRDPAQTRAQHA